MRVQEHRREAFGRKSAFEFPILPAGPFFCSFIGRYRSLLITQLATTWPVVAKVLQDREASPILIGNSLRRRVSQEKSMRAKPVFTLLALAAAVVSTSSWSNVQSTVPNAFATTAGTGGFLGPLASAARTYQLLIDESQLTEHLGNSLNAISFRLLASASAAWPAVSVNYANYDIRVSGGVDPSARSLTFANNVVGTQTLVRSGALAITPGSFSSGSVPNMFGQSIGFDSGYLYNGGDLLIEIRHTGSNSATSVDAMIATDGAAAGYGTLFSAAWIGNYTGLTGTQGNFSVLQVSSVPEPATMLLLAAGMLALVARANSRQRSLGNSSDRQ